MTRIYFVFIFSAFFVFSNLCSNLVLGQVDTTNKQQLEDYQWRISQSNLHGVYIPSDIEDAIEELKGISSREALDKFKRAPEEEIAKKLFFGVGKWITSNWQFYEGSRFSHYLRDAGISHPDDMTIFVLESLHRHLNDKDLNMEERVELLRKERMKKVQSQMRRDTIRRDTIFHGQ
nr:hypothetical protein [Saprospiraceae bacterium]